VSSSAFASSFSTSAPARDPAPTAPALVVTDADAIRWITFSRPATLNALTLRDLDDFACAVEGAPASVRAIAVTGSGERAFCAGMHTSVFAGLGREGAREVISKVARAVGSLRLSPKPTAVLLNGYTIGAGFEMALAADFRVAYPGVKVGLPETKVGIPSVVDAALLQRHVGLSFAKEMILIGDLYPVEELGRRFVNRFAEPGQIAQTAEKLLGKVTDLTPVVMRAQKELHETWVNSSLTDSIARSIDVFADVFVDPSTHEAVEKYNNRNKK
jgi:enoyl-CoA hydratase/carnithine racemase